MFPFGTTTEKPSFTTFSVSLSFAWGASAFGYQDLVALDRMNERESCLTAQVNRGPSLSICSRKQFMARAYLDEVNM